MFKKGKTIIVTILLLTFVLGIFSISGPKPVTGEGEPPIPYDPNDEIPLENEPVLDEQIQDEQTDGDFEGYLTEELEPNEEYIPDLVWTSYTGAAFHGTDIGVFYDGCAENFRTIDRYTYASVNLPDKSIIKWIEVLGYDKLSNAEVTVEFMQSRGSQQEPLVITELGSGISYNKGTFVNSIDINHTVHNGLGYFVRVLLPAWDPDWINLGMRICNVKIGYIPPSPFANALPFVRNNK